MSIHLIRKEYVFVHVCVFIVRNRYQIGLKINHVKRRYSPGDNLMEETNDVFLHMS